MVMELHATVSSPLMRFCAVGLTWQNFHQVIYSSALDIGMVFNAINNRMDLCQEIFA